MWPLPIPARLIKPLIYLAAVAALGGALWWLHHHIDAQGYKRGKDEVYASFAERDKAAEEKAQARIRELEVKHRDKERQYADNLQTIGVKLSEVQQNAQRNETVLRARLATRNLVLRDPGARSPDKSCGGGVPQTATAPSGSDGGKGSELSNSAAEFLLTLAGEADAVARQLAACQDTVRSDRK